MSTDKRIEEQISAFMDGELDEASLSVLLAGLKDPEQRTAWDIYHQVGDVLRSDDMGFALSPDFAARMNARLESEPIIAAPIRNSNDKSLFACGDLFGAGRKFLSGIKRSVPLMTGVAATVAIIFGAMHFKFSDSPSTSAHVVASSSNKTQATNLASALSSLPVSLKDQTSPHTISVSSAASENMVMLRDPRIDEYLLAHQPFSPSLYGGAAQYTRSATLTNEAHK